MFAVFHHAHKAIKIPWEHITVYGTYTQSHQNLFLMEVEGCDVVLLILMYMYVVIWGTYRYIVHSNSFIFSMNQELLEGYVLLGPVDEE